MATAKGSTKASSSKGSSSKADHSQGNKGTSGTWNEKQPLSKADKNTGGANGKCPGGPYCSTRKGDPSMNGNGKGKATGKPCAGCVGKADNKNPKGQYPNGSDRNAGYECDRNNGIGKTNPAHTGCTTSTPPPPPPAETCPDGSPLPPGGVKDCSKPPVKTCPDGSPLPPGGVQECSTPPPPVKTCPDGSPLPPGGVQDCSTTPPPAETCPDGSPLPAGGIAACEEPPGGGEVEVCPEGQEMVNGECVVVGGEETVVPPLPDIAGVETLVPRPQQRPAPNAEVLGAQAVAGAPAALPATGASSGMGLMTGAGFLLLATGTALVLRRRLA